MGADRSEAPREGGETAASRAGAVLLAAGESRRMGGVNKLLIELDGVPMVRRMLDAIRDAGIGEIVVVRGHQAERVEPLVRAPGVKLVRNADHALGQQGSVLAGLRALSVRADPVMVVLGDLPLLEASDVEALLDAFASRPAGARVLRPRYDGRRGNPVVVERWVVDRVLAEAGPSAGLREFIDAHRAIVASFDASSDHYVFDLDTREDIGRLERRTGRAVRVPDGPEATQDTGPAARRARGEQ